MSEEKKPVSSRPIFVVSDGTGDTGAAVARAALAQFQVDCRLRRFGGILRPSLARADLVLTGVSRTSKTPLSMYLAQRGYKTGNVPIVPGIEPPRALLELDPKKVFALTIDPSLLLTIRQARVRALGAPPYSTY